MTFIAGVCYANAPLERISAMHSEILARGWREEDRGDPWLAAYEKVIPEGEQAKAVAELRSVLGEYWLSDDEFRKLRDS
jgi:hypothetical protein